MTAKKDAREAAANRIAAYVVAVLERQLDAGADRRFETREDFTDLGRSIIWKLNELIEHRSKRADEKKRAGGSGAERKPSQVFAVLDVSEI